MDLLNRIYTELNAMLHRPFVRFVLSELALDWKRGWGDFVLIQTSLFFIGKFKLVTIRTG